MWSYGKDRYISSMEELYETEEERQNRRSWLLCKLMYYSCCFTKNPPYNQNAKERESSADSLSNPILSTWIVYDSDKMSNNN